MGLADTIRLFLEEQLAEWPLLRTNTLALANCQTRELLLDGYMPFTVQYNPHRAISTGATVSQEAIAARPCFLCSANRPAEQRGLTDIFSGFEILANPYPIFKGHLTIASSSHQPQRASAISSIIREMADAMEDYVVFFNGARCGASAPDHLHLQAVPKSQLPLTFGDSRLPYLYQSEWPLKGEYDSEMCNLLAFKCKDNVRLIAVPRKAHRPKCYGHGESQMLISPASVDLGGVIITPRKYDFDALTADKWMEIIKETCYECS